jgi:hypothetical protein
MIHVLDECATCGKRMRLTHAVPRSESLPELQSFKCYFCNEVVTKAAGEFPS